MLNTRGYLSQNPLFPSRSLDLSVISCHYSTSPPANEICPCYAVVANRHSIVVNAHYLAVFAHLKQHRSPLMNSQPRTKSVEHPQTPFCCPQARGWPHQQLGPHWNWQVKYILKCLLDPNWNKMQEDPVRLTATKLEKYLCVFLNRASEIYSLSWIMVCVHWLMQSCPARQTPAPNLNPCDCMVCSRWTQINKSAWILNLFLSTCLECLKIWKRGWTRQDGCLEERKPGALMFQTSVLLFNFCISLARMEKSCLALNLCLAPISSFCSFSLAVSKIFGIRRTKNPISFARNVPFIF